MNDSEMREVLNSLKANPGYAFVTDTYALVYHEPSHQIIRIGGDFKGLDEAEANRRIQKVLSESEQRRNAPNN